MEPLDSAMRASCPGLQYSPTPSRYSAARVTSSAAPEEEKEEKQKEEEKMKEEVIERECRKAYRDCNASNVCGRVRMRRASCSTEY